MLSLCASVSVCHSDSYTQNQNKYNNNENKNGKEIQIRMKYECFNFKIECLLIVSIEKKVLFVSALG